MAMTARRPLAIRILLALLLFQGFSGVAGGWGLTSDPTGSAIGLDLEWLEGSPFPDYLIPGLVLLVILGIGPLVVMGGILWRLRRAWFAALLVGVALVVWIVVQVLVIGYVSRPPLQLVYGLLGLGIVVTTLLPSMRRRFL
jgi:hypothetical protein